MILMSQTSGKDLTTQMASLTLKKKKENYADADNNAGDA